MIKHEDTKITKTHENITLYKVGSCVFVNFVTSWFLSSRF